MEMLEVLNDGTVIGVDSVTIRIDGNKNFEYAKVSATTVDGAIYIIKYGDLNLLTDGFIMSETIKGHSDNYIELLRLIRNNYKAIVSSIRDIKNGREIVQNLNWIEGFSVSKN